MKTYLGDAVYIELYECGDIELTTNNGIEITNAILLEPEVIKNLLRFLDKNKLLPE
jgi:hypothetical protein